MSEIYVVMMAIKLIGEFAYCFFMLFRSEEEWNKITRLTLAIFLLILTVMTAIICFVLGKTMYALTSCCSILIWIVLTEMAISRLRDSE